MNLLADFRASQHVERLEGEIAPLQLLRALMRRAKIIRTEGGQATELLHIAKHAPLISFGIRPEILEAAYSIDFVAAALVQAAPLAKASKTMMADIIDEHENMYLIHQSGGDVCRTHFFYAHIHGGNLSGDGIDKMYYDWNESGFCEDGKVYAGTPEKDVISKIFLLALSFLAMNCPEENCKFDIPAGSTTIRRKRTPIESMVAIVIPRADFDFQMRVANSNLRWIVTKDIVFPRSRIETESGQTLPGYMIRCDEPGCNRQESVTASNASGSLPQVVIHRKLKQAGWKVNGQCLCPDHANPKPKEPPMPKVTVTPPRDMSPADRRKVFREIDDCWDEAKGRYAGSHSDQEIASKLDVPRKWVSDIREESFGKTQRNGELEKLASEAKRLSLECEKALNASLEMAGSYEKFQTELAVLQARIEAIE